MKRLVIAASAALMVILFAFPAAAQVGGPKFALHVQSHAAKASLVCTTADPTDPLNNIGCSGFTTTGDVGVGYDLYLVIGQADSNGVAGATFGIRYDGGTPADGSGIDVVGPWTLCATGLEFPSNNWPDTGEGNVITWNTANCGTRLIAPDGRHGTAGVFYIYAYSADTFTITPHLKQQGGPNLEVANCNGASFKLDANSGILGSVAIGGGSGCNPCVTTCTTPVEAETWGGIKAKYRN